MKKDALLSENVWNWLLHRNDPEKEVLFFEKLNKHEQSEFYDLRTDFLTEYNERIELLKRIAQSKINYNKLFQDHAFYLELLDSLHTPVFAKNHEMKFVFFNRAYEKAFGIQRNSLIGKTVHELNFLSDEYKNKSHNEEEQIINELSQQRRTTSLRFTDGMRNSYYWTCGINITSINKRGLVGQILDISELNTYDLPVENDGENVETEATKIEHLFRHDLLTGLGNHITMHEQLSELIQMSDRYGHPFCICMISIDDFENINDKFDRNAGDQVLKDVAELLRLLSRKIDIPIRYSGQCFILLSPMTTITKGKIMADRLSQMLHEEILLPDNTCISGNVGLIEYQNDESIDETMTRLKAEVDEAKTKANYSVTS